MYDWHLNTFITVADCGSFLKAAEKLFISANAVTKQINLLEDRFGVKLFHRSTRGLTLTEAGRYIYDEARQMIRHADAVLQKARALEGRQAAVVRIGASLMNPADGLLAQWDRASARYPRIKVEIVPFEDTAASFRSLLDHLGSRVDIVPCAYNTHYWGDRFRSLHLTDLPVCIACARSHPLAGKKRLCLADLYGETVILAAHRDEQASKLSALLEQTGRIRVEAVEYYDYNVFNRAVTSGALIVSAPLLGGRPSPAGNASGGLGFPDRLRPDLSPGAARRGAPVHSGGRRPACINLSKKGPGMQFAACRGLFQFPAAGRGIRPQAAGNMI